MDAVLQFFRVVLFIGIVLTLLLVGGFVGIFAADSVFGPKASVVSNISYPAADGSQLLAYINIQPGPEIRPAVIMLSDVWGLDDQITRLTNLLADEGYVVIAPDLYRGAASAMVPRAYLLSLMTPGDQVMNDVQSAFDYVTTIQTVNPDAIGMIGFGYGGTMTLRYAAQNQRVSAVVNAYGDVLTSPNALGELRGPVLGLFAGRDTQARSAQINQFGALLDEAGIENDLTVYNNLSSGFFRFPEIAVIGSSIYNAWHDVVAFFDSNLK